MQCSWAVRQALDLSAAVCLHFQVVELSRLRYSGQLVNVGLQWFLSLSLVLWLFLLHYTQDDNQLLKHRFLRMYVCESAIVFYVFTLRAPQINLNFPRPSFTHATYSSQLTAHTTQTVCSPLLLGSCSAQHLSEL